MIMADVEVSAPKRLEAHFNERLYADLDPEALSAAMLAYSEAYAGSWARALVAAIRAYLRTMDKPTYAAPSDKEIGQALAEAFERSRTQPDEKGNPS